MIVELAKNLQPDVPFHAYPPASDRTAWERLPVNLRADLIKEGEKYLGLRPPSILMTDFMEFSRTGNRSHYEDLLFERMTVLDALVLAECAEYRGRFLDDVINLIFLICEETAWQLPAHNSDTRSGAHLLLPDAAHPVLELFAAEAGAVLSVAEYLLRDALGAVSPAISALVNQNLELRIFKPYLTEHFWWMGDGKTPMCNWTSWCTQNVLLAAFTRPSGYWENDNTDCRKEADEQSENNCPEGGIPDRRAAIFRKACQSLDYFLDSYGEDGCCDEGAVYFRHAGLTLFDALEILNDVTAGGFLSAYDAPKVRNIAAYIQNVHVKGPYYANFADCSPIAGRCGVREYLFGKRTHQPALAAFAASDFREGGDWLTPDEHNLFYRLQTVFYFEEMMACQPDTSHPRDIYYESAGLFLARDPVWFLAVKAGCNADSHNHNDVGSFTIYKNGQPFLIDVGVESYTAKTFSDRRYEIWTMQSCYHNLPSFGGVTQHDGAQYRATDVVHSFREGESAISMDIAGAYPDKRITLYRRNAVLKKGVGIEITDTCCAPPAELTPVVLSLMTYEAPHIEEANDTFHSAAPSRTPLFRIRIGSLGECLVTGASEIKCEEIPITDPWLARVWKHPVYRVLVTMEGRKLHLKIS